MRSGGIKGPCSHLIDWRPRTLSWCEAPGEGWRIETSAGRPPAIAGPYCDTHGGVERARREAESDWMVLAPPVVGDAGAVLDAGVASLRTEHAYVVVRELEGDWWTPGIGIGSHYEDLPGTWRSARDATAYAIQVWRRRLELRMVDLVKARGGDLSWGLPVRPMARPFVVEIGIRGNAMDAASWGDARPAQADLPSAVGPEEIASERVRHPGTIDQVSRSGATARWAKIAGRWEMQSTGETVWPAPSKLARDQAHWAAKQPDFDRTITADDAEAVRKRRIEKRR